MVKKLIRSLAVVGICGALTFTDGFTTVQAATTAQKTNPVKSGNTTYTLYRKNVTNSSKKTTSYYIGISTSTEAESEVLLSAKMVNASTGKVIKTVSAHDYNDGESSSVGCQVSATGSYVLNTIKPTYKVKGKTVTPGTWVKWY